MKKTFIDIVQMSDEVISAIEEINNTEAIKTFMIESISNVGGINNQSATIAMLSIEHIRSRLGVKKTDKFIATESFTSNNDKLLTKIVIENISDFIKTVWENILKAINFIIDKIKSLFNYSNKDRSKQIN